MTIHIRVGENYLARMIRTEGEHVHVIWLPHAAGTSTGSELVARLVADRGWTVTSLLPPGDLPRPEAPVEEWVTLVEERVRAGRAALRVRVNDPHQCVTVMGVSVGGIAALRVAELENSVDVAVGMLAGSGDDGLLHAARAYGAAAAIPSPEARKRLDAIDPALHTKDLGSRHTLLVRAWFDDVITSESSDALRAALGDPPVQTYPTGHESFVYVMPLAVKRALDWVDEACATQLKPAR